MPDASSGTAGRRSWLKTLRSFSIFLALQGIAILVLLEIVGRAFDPGGVSYYPETARFLETMILEQPIGYRNRPGLEGDYFGQRVSINTLGLRHPEIELGPRPDRFRVLLLGDSVVFGVAVAADETLSAHLERRVRENSGEVDGREVEVINMGVISYNTEQELIQYQTLGSKLQADLVLILVSENDIEPKMWVFEKRADPVRAFAQRSYAISLIFALLRSAGDRFATGPTRIRASDYRKGHPRRQAIEESLVELNQMARQAGIPMVVFTRRESGPSFDLLSEVSRRGGFPLESLTPFADPRWQDLDPRDFRARGGGGHPNGEALGMFATLIYERLEKLGLLASP